jgi:hypothetical protein
MVDGEGTPGAEGAQEGDNKEDPLQNLKSEMQRKLSNTDATLTQLLESQKALQAQLAAAAQPKPVSSGEAKSFEDRIYAGEGDAVLGELEDRIVKKTNEANQQFQNDQAEKQAALLKLVQEYPEINQAESPLYQAAAQEMAGFAPQDQGTPQAMRMAVYQAAAKLGLKPKANRTNANDDFSVRGGGGNPPPKKTPKGDLSEDTEVIAQLMGVDTSDPKRRESLKKHSQRKNWHKFSSEGGDR